MCVCMSTCIHSHVYTLSLCNGIYINNKINVRLYIVPLIYICHSIPHHLFLYITYNEYLWRNSNVRLSVGQML